MKSALIVATLALLVGAIQSQQYGENSYSSNAGYSSGGAYGDAGATQERPRVNLGISLKVPAMKINLGRMNMPKISIRAKIKNNHGPKVINVPEMHIDTNSKIPGPQGAQAAGHGGADYSQGGYGNGGSTYNAGYNADSSASNYGAGSSSGYESSSSGSSYSSGPSESYGSSMSGYSAPSELPQYGSNEGADAYSAPQQMNNYNQNANYANQGGYGGHQADSAPGYEMPASYSSNPSPSGGHYEPSGSSYAAMFNEPPAYNKPAAMPNYMAQMEQSYSAPKASGNYNKQQSMTHNMRNQYGSSPNVYNQQANQYAQSIYSAPTQSYSSSSGSSRGYSTGQQSYAAPAQQSYAAPAQQSYAAPAQPSYVGSATSNYNSMPNRGYNSANQMSGSYQASSASAPRTYSTPANSYNPSPKASNSYGSSSYGAAPSYGSEPIGYQPLEPGHTLITASNDNYHGMTQVSMASNPPKDAGHQTSNYGVQPNHSSYQAPATNYQPSSYSASQSMFDDGANYGSNQGNYGARMPSNAGYGMEAY